ncbi:MAG: hypothetical protein AB7T22_04335 [Calditrichaceae bacterium]
MKKYVYYCFAVFLIFQNAPLKAENTLWISNMPPKDTDRKIQPFGMHKISSVPVPGMRGTFHIIQWIRGGTLPVESVYLSEAPSANAEIHLLSPENKLIDCKQENGTIIYDGNPEGFYNLYLTDKYVSGDTLYIINAKAERLSHKCQNGHKHVLANLQPKDLKSHITYEIIRDRLPREDYHTFIQSGDKVTFGLILKGNPVSGSRVKLITQTGWAKLSKTDINGEVTFQIPEDYFSAVTEFEKQKIFNFLIVAEHGIAENGVFDGSSYKQVRYTATFSESYIPSKMMYSSAVWAMIVFVFALSLTAGAVFYYRERKKVPYREVTFNE